jgi:transcriptional regulator with XRE-family HTH domain
MNHKSRTLFYVTAKALLSIMMFMLQTIDLCRRIKLLMKQRGIKQETLALAIGKQRPTLANKLMGRTKLYYDEIVAISEALGAPDLVADTREWQPRLDPKVTVLIKAMEQLPLSIQHKQWRKILDDLYWYARETHGRPLDGHARRKPRRKLSA